MEPSYDALNSTPSTAQNEMGRWTSVITRNRAKDVIKAIVVEPTSHDVLDSTAQNKMGVIVEDGR